MDEIVGSAVQDSGFVGATTVAVVYDADRNELRLCKYKTANTVNILIIF